MTLGDALIFTIVAVLAFVLGTATWWIWAQLLTFVDLVTTMLDIIHNSGEPWI